MPSRASVRAPGAGRPAAAEQLTAEIEDEAGRPGRALSMAGSIAAEHHLRRYRPRSIRESRRSLPVADVEAHITGVVWKIEVAVGDTVSEGDTVLILESMKMEMPVEAEDEGTVKEILVAEGQPVSEGDTLVVLE
jgi:acetyl-CoA carboxylase biotin carboxyl carrier protein